MIIAGLIIASIIAMFVVTSILSKRTPINKANPRKDDDGAADGDAADGDAADGGAADGDAAGNRGGYSVQPWQQAVIITVVTTN